MPGDRLGKLQASLLRGLRRELGPEDGDEAFERHILLAVRIHRAAGLNQTVEGEGKGWVEYFNDHFPSPRNLTDDAWCLWEDWRVGLVKLESPKRRVAVTHGQPWLHWYRETPTSLCVDLESMWDDFEVSVSSFIALLERDTDRRDDALRRFDQRSWTVRPLAVRQQHTTLPIGNLLSASSASAMGPEPPLPPPPGSLKLGPGGEPNA